jgi:hypothetical protein
LDQVVNLQRTTQPVRAQHIVRQACMLQWQCWVRIAATACIQARTPQPRTNRCPQQLPSCSLQLQSRCCCCCCYWSCLSLEQKAAVAMQLLAQRSCCLVSCHLCSVHMWPLALLFHNGQLTVCGYSASACTASLLSKQ